MSVTGAGINQDSLALDEQRRRQDDAAQTEASKTKDSKTEKEKAKPNRPRQGLASQRAGQKITRTAERAAGSRNQANNRSEANWQTKGAKSGSKTSVFPAILKPDEISNVHDKRTRDFYEALNIMDAQLNNPNNAYMRLGDNKIAFISLAPSGKDRMGVIELKDKSVFKDLNLGAGDWKHLSTLENSSVRNTIVKLRKQAKEQQKEYEQFKGKNTKEKRKAYSKSKAIASEIARIKTLSVKGDSDKLSAMAEQIKAELSKAKDISSLDKVAKRLDELKHEKIKDNGKEKTIAKTMLDERISAAKASGYYSFLESKFKDLKDGVPEHEVSGARVNYDKAIDQETIGSNQLSKDEHKAFAANHKKLKEQKQKADKLLKAYNALSPGERKAYPALARFESKLKNAEYEHSQYQKLIELEKNSIKNPALKNDLTAQVNASGAGKYLQTQQKMTLAMFKGLNEDPAVLKESKAMLNPKPKLNEDIEKRFSHLKKEDRERLIASAKKINAMNKTFASMRSNDPSIISMPGYRIYANTASHVNSINEARLELLSDKDIYKKFNNNINSLLSSHEELADLASRTGTGIQEEKLFFAFNQSKPRFTPEDLKYNNSGSLRDEHQKLYDEYQQIKDSDGYVDDKESKEYAEKLRNFYKNLSADDIKASIHKLYGEDGYDIERLMKEVNSVDEENSPSKEVLKERYKTMNEIKANLGSKSNSELFASLNEFVKHASEFSLLAPRYINIGK